MTRALAILESFTPEMPSHAVTELSRRVKLTTPTVYRLLKTLAARDMVVRDPLSRRYSLGAGIMRLAGVIMQRDDVHALALPHLDALRRLTGETVGLHVRIGQHRVCIAELVSPHPIRMASGVGRAYPLHAGAAGKVLLAWLPGNDLDELLAAIELRPLTARTLTTRKALGEELARVRAHGFATSFGESVAGASALAAQVLDYGGRPVAAINITGPEHRWTLARMRKAKDALVRRADEIMRQLGHRGAAR